MVKSRAKSANSEQVQAGAAAGTGTSGTDGVHAGNGAREGTCWHPHREDTSK